MPAARRLNGIDIADQIRNCHIRRSQFFDVPVLGSKPRYRRSVSFLRNEFAAAAANRSIRIIVNFAARDVRHLRIEERRHPAQDAAFRLPAQSQKNEIMPRKNRVHDLRHYRIVVSNNAGKYRPALAQPRHQILAQLIFYAPRP